MARQSILFWLDQFDITQDTPLDTIHVMCEGYAIKVMTSASGCYSAGYSLSILKPIRKL